MRLISCHIDNFGKLQDYSVDFTENPMVFLKPNGWGKSTLAAFVKVMFYGFANEKKRGDALERERLRYKPWQGGVCGGELEFEAGGRRYRLNRTFGAKESEDTFALYDAQTNLSSEDFTCNIGEELFQINQESFLRTVYIAQSDCVTGATDSINAKIGNLADNLEDMNNYERVQQRLKDLRNALTPSRKTGALWRRKDEMSQLRDELRRRESVEDALAKLEGRLADCREERNALAEKREILQRQWESAVRQKEGEAKRRHYESILRQCQERKLAADRGLEALGGRLPDRGLLEKMQERRRLMIRQESESRAAALSEEESRTLDRIRREFESGVPADELLEQGRRLCDELDGLQAESFSNRLSGEEEQEMQRLTERFADWKGSEEALERRLEEGLGQCELCNEKAAGLGAKKAMLSSLRMVEESARRAGNTRRHILRAVLLLSGAVLLAVVLYCLWKQEVLGVLPGLAGAALLVGGVLAGRLPKRAAEDAGGGSALLERELAEDEEQIARAQSAVESLAGELGLPPADWETGGQHMRENLYHLKGDWKRLCRLRARVQDYRGQDYEGRMEQGQRRLWEMLVPYVSPERMRNEKARLILAELGNDKETFARLTEQEQRAQRAYQSCVELQAQLEQFLEECGQHELGNLDVCLQKVSSVMDGYESDLEELDRLMQEKEAFEAANDVEVLVRQEEQPDAEELRRLLAESDERLEALGENMHLYLKQLDERQQELDELQRRQEQLDGLEEVYAREEAYYTNLGLTSEYLALAKDSLSARYIGPVLEAFKRYYALLDEDESADFRMDANICVTRREAGEQRDIRAFSAGSRDLVYIALRMAMVEAMYRKEKPFLIVDDSFVNLDGERLVLAGRFLKKLAGEYQLLYFTCHESRML